VTRFAARAIFVGRTTCHAKSRFRIARARTVALQYRLGTSDQRVATESGHTTTLNAVVDDFALGARAASGRAVAGRCTGQTRDVLPKRETGFPPTFRLTSTLFVDARLVVGTRSIAATTADTQTILAYLIRVTFRVRIAHGLADSVVAPFVGQTLHVPKWFRASLG